MIRITGLTALLGVVTLLGNTTGGEAKKDGSGANTVHFKVMPLELAEEFARTPDKAERKYRPKEPFKAAIDITGDVAKVEKNDIYLASESQVMVILRAKKVDGKVDGPTAVLATDGRFKAFRANTVEIEFDKVKLVPVGRK